MEMTSTRIVPAPPAAVWTALNDPEALKAAIPGCESMERIGDDEWRATMAAKVGPVSARFTGTMKMTESTPPTGYTLISLFANSTGATNTMAVYRKTITPAGATGTPQLTWGTAGAYGFSVGFISKA